MTTTLHAQPYDTSATGFYFKSLEEYQKTAPTIKNDFGGTVEEFEIQLIDADGIDCELAKAIGINQANIERFFECVEGWC